MTKSIDISELIDTQYKEFARYTCFKRAIPSLIDGFKPSQRKAFFCVKGKGKFTKVVALSGEMISRAEYHHGDVSASDVITNMSKDFTGSNQIPPFLKDGSFGNKFVKDASSPRYIYSKPNPVYYNLFADHEIVKPNPDPETPEPLFYLPIIPTILLNGVDGIAVGFATHILPYSIDDIKRYIRGYVENDKSDVKLEPYFGGYTGKIIYDSDIEKYVMCGVYQKVNTSTIKITEIPVNLDRAKYIKILTKLEDDGLITSWQDNSKTQWDVTLKLPRASKLWEDPVKHLKLKYNLNESLTVLDENNKIVVFDSVYDIINHFIQFRLKVYGVRKRFMMNKLKEDILFNQSKIKFIKLFTNIDFKNMTKKEIRDLLVSKKCREDFIERLLNIKVYNLSADEIQSCKELIEKLKTEFVWYKKITVMDLYKIDLKNI